MASDKTPIEWTLLPLKRYAQFSGRSGRAEFWWFTLAYTAIGFAIDAIEWAMSSEWGILGLIFTLALFIPSLSVTVRRFHDIGMSGWWILVMLIPAVLFGMQSSFAALESEFSGAEAGAGSFVVAIALLVAGCLALVVCMVLPGNKGGNKYGSDPYGGANGKAFA